MLDKSVRTDGRLLIGLGKVQIVVYVEDLSGNDNGTTNKTALDFPEIISQCPNNALINWLNDTKIDEKSFCPITQLDFLIVEPNVVSHFGLFVEIPEEILIFLHFCFLNAKLRFFAVWDEQLCLFTVRW